MSEPITHDDLARMAAEALEPFAYAALLYEDKNLPSDTHAAAGFTVGDLRRAREVRAAILEAGAKP